MIKAINYTLKGWVRHGKVSELRKNAEVYFFSEKDMYFILLRISNGACSLEGSNAYIIDGELGDSDYDALIEGKDFTKDDANTFVKMYNDRLSLCYY